MLAPHWAYREVPEDMPEVYREQAPAILQQFGPSVIIGGPAARSGFDVRIGLLAQNYHLNYSNGRDIDRELGR